MKIISAKNQICSCCMEAHDVKTVQVKEFTVFKNTDVEYDAVYYYCDIADEMYADEEMLRQNDILMKDAYRRSVGLLTSDEIRAVREKYDISQNDLCVLLGWGAKTVTRYEGHQVQDKANDTILRKLRQDPAWFLQLLVSAKESLSADLYAKYYEKASLLYEDSRDSYLRQAIEAQYAKFKHKHTQNGNTVLSLDKVVDVIRYFSASGDVANLYKVKLMKLLWYADNLSFKRRGHSITGLVYQALPMGAVPIGHDTIIDLKRVPCNEEFLDYNVAYHFYLKDSDGKYPSLDKSDKEILDSVIAKFGQMSTEQIVDFMHKEKAYVKTNPRDIIDFRFADSILI